MHELVQAIRKELTANPELMEVNHKTLTQLFAAVTNNNTGIMKRTISGSGAQRREAFNEIAKQTIEDKSKPLLDMLTESASLCSGLARDIIEHCHMYAPKDFGDARDLFRKMQAMSASKDDQRLAWTMKELVAALEEREHLSEELSVRYEELFPENAIG